MREMVLSGAVAGRRDADRNLRHDLSVRRFAWKIGPLSFPLLNNPLPQRNSMKAVEPGY